MKGRAIPYSAAELAWVQANKGMVAGELHAHFCARFRRTDVSAINLCSLRKRNGWETGRTGRFELGQVPPNKGKPMPYHPNSAATRFKKGQRTGRAAVNYKPIGAERIVDGYLERKLHDGMPFRTRWRAVHILRWEEVHGPVPEGRCLKSLDGDRLNTDPSNWEAIPRGVAVRLNGGRHKRSLAYDDATPEVKPTIMAIAKLKHAARTKKSTLAASSEWPQPKQGKVG